MIYVKNCLKIKEGIKNIAKIKIIMRKDLNEFLNIKNE